MCTEDNSIFATELWLDLSLSSTSPAASSAESFFFSPKNQDSLLFEWASEWNKDILKPVRRKADTISITFSSETQGKE